MCRCVHSSWVQAAIAHLVYYVWCLLCRSQVWREKENCCVAGISFMLNLSSQFCMKWMLPYFQTSELELLSFFSGQECETQRRKGTCQLPPQDTRGSLCLPCNWRWVRCPVQWDSGHLARTTLQQMRTPLFWYLILYEYGLYLLKVMIDSYFSLVNKYCFYFDSCHFLFWL